MRAALLALLLVAACAIGCARKPADATPEGALELFLQALDDTSHDPSANARAYALLDPASRESLRVRAARATSITGKALVADQMLAPVWSSPRFAIERMHAEIDGTGARAMVDVFGADPVMQHVRVPLVREGEAWRVEMGLTGVEGKGG